MFLEITDVILIALFIEAIVNAIKPIWTKGETQLTVSEYVSMGMGVLLAVTCKINMLAYVVEAVDYPLWVEYIFYVLTGIAIGRGTNFLYDLWSKLKEWKSGDLLLRSRDVFVDSVDSDDLKNAMSVNALNDFERHGSSALDGIEISAGRAETAFAAKRNKFERTTRRTPIHGSAISRISAMNHLFDAFKNNRASLKGVLDFFVMI